MIRVKYSFNGRWTNIDNIELYEWIGKYKEFDIDRAFMCWVPVDEFWGEQ